MGWGYYKIDGLTCPICNSEAGECACGDEKNYNDDGCGGYECAKGHYFTIEDLIKINILIHETKGGGG